VLLGNADGDRPCCGPPKRWAQNAIPPSTASSFRIISIVISTRHCLNGCWQAVPMARFAAGKAGDTDRDSARPSKLKAKTNIHRALKQGFLKFTASDQQRIRHALLEKGALDRRRGGTRCS
jgi:hypothetical protein